MCCVVWVSDGFYVCVALFLKNCRFLGSFGAFLAENTNFDNNWSNIITLDHFWAKISDFLALSKKFQNFSKVKTFESDSFGQIMAQKRDKTKKYGG